MPKLLRLSSAWLPSILPAESPLDADLAEMGATRLVSESFWQLRESESSIHNGSSIRGIERGHVVLLIAALATIRPCRRACLRISAEVGISLPASKDTDECDMTTGANGFDGLRQGAGAAYLDHMIDTTTAGQHFNSR